MRIYRINAVYGRGSTGRTALQLDEALKAYGHNCRTAAVSGSGDFFNLGNKAGNKLHAVLARLFGNAGYYSRFGTRKLMKDITRYSPDVIHLHNLHSNFICVPKLLDYIAKKGIPAVITLHDCWFYTGKCCHYTLDGCDRWKSGCGKCPRLHKDIPSLFFDRTVHMLRDKKEKFTRIKKLAVVGVSDWITNEARQSILGGALMIRRIYNWVDLEAFAPREMAAVKRLSGTEGRRIIIGVATQWSAAKGLRDFIALAKLLENDKVIVLIGRMNGASNLPPNIISVPNIDSQAELAEYYAMADVYVSFSPEESFGKTTAEALACGTPVIVLDSTASPELVGDGCGMIVKKGDIGSAKKAVDTILYSGKAAYSDLCRGYAEKNFDMKVLVKEYLELYKQML